MSTLAWGPPASGSSARCGCPVGAGSPLWAVFGAAAGVGVAWWWLSHWTRIVNVEALTARAGSGAPAPAAEAVLSPVADDLTRLTGIGPKLSQALAARGVTRFAHIAAWTADDIAEADRALSLKGQAIREAWVAQAKRLAGE